MRPALRPRRRRGVRVAGDDGEIEELAVGAQVELDEIDAEVCGQLEVVADLLGEAGLQIALRKAFKELPEGVVLGGRNHGAEAIEERGVEFGVVADFVY